MSSEKSDYGIPPTRLETMSDDAGVIADAVKKALERIHKPQQ